jgi:hypothetical protein
MGNVIRPGPSSADRTAAPEPAVAQAGGSSTCLEASLSTLKPPTRRAETLGLR